MTTVVNVRTHQGPSHYIGRKIGPREASKWGNPHKLTADTRIGRATALAHYLAHLQRRRDLWLALHELRGQTLACWCHPEPCHGHVLAQLADALTDHGKPCPKCKAAMIASLINTTKPGEFKQYARCPQRHCVHYQFSQPFQITTPFLGPTGALFNV